MALPTCECAAGLNEQDLWTVIVQATRVYAGLTEDECVPGLTETEKMSAMYCVLYNLLNP